jgi:OOP family OmpA-OmpF porin
MRSTTLAGLLAVSFFGSTLFIQPARAQVLQGDQITERALLDALAPMELVGRGEPDSGAGQQPANPRKASILIEFQTNAAALTQSAKQELGVVAGALKSERLARFPFVLEGHADPRGNPERNLRLSQARADSVRQYLVESQNISAARLQAIGKGDREPLNRENPAAPENRRVTIVRLPAASR